MRRLVYILLGFSLIGLAGCSNAKRIAEGKPLIPRDPGYIIKHSEKNALDWDWLAFKLDTEIEVNDAKESFTLNVRMAKDSVIWASLTPALGVEVARIKLDPDSVRLISKIPMNKFVYEGDYDELQGFLGVPFDFYTFQELFSGSSLGLGQDNEKFISKVDGHEYVLVEKFPRKVKKLLGGVDERSLTVKNSDSLSVILNHRRANRVMDRTDSEDLLIKRYWFDGVSFAPTVDIFDDLQSGLTIRVERSGLEEHEEGFLPKYTILKAIGDGVNLEAELEIKRSRINKEYDLPFDSPEDYERRTRL